MLKYRGHQLIRAGFIGVVLIVLIIAVGLNPGRADVLGDTVRYQALFTEAGGLVAGNDVNVSGMKVGSVSDVSLHNGKAVVTLQRRQHSAAGLARPPPTSAPDRCWANGC